MALTDFLQKAVQQSFNLDGAGIIAVQGPTSRTLSDLQFAAGAIRKQLPADAEGEWCVSLQSPFGLLATLWALQAAGGTPILLAHTRPNLLAKMGQSCRGFIFDEPIQVAEAPTQPASIIVPAFDTLLDQGLNMEAIQASWTQPIGFMTSGSSGEPARIFKTPAQLVAEIEVLESVFGAVIGEERTFCGTTSHQHLFGFTFRLMWPLLTGRQLADEQIRIPGEVRTAIRHHGRILLISSPAFLERAAGLMDMSDLHPGAFVGFSSGGPLDPATAIEFNQIQKNTLIEIYGSTETGALAWRVTDRVTDRIASPPWRPFPQISVRTEDDRLSVSGPHLPDSGFHLTEDLVELVDHGFHLKGRRDQIVKVADKRVSLTELNQLLCEPAQVTDGRVVQLADSTLAAVVVPSAAGWKEIEKQGKRAFCGRLRDHMSMTVDRVTSPKRWRIIRQLPRNTQGKLALDELLALFQVPNDTPRWQTLDSSSSHWTGEARIEPDLLVLEGHFPQHPVIPGVALVHWAAVSARKAFQIDQFSGSMQAIKFMNPVRPGITLRLKLDYNIDRHQVRYQYSDDGCIYSTGRLRIRAD